MKSVRMLGACVLALFAIGAASASSAFAAAEPEFTTSLAGKIGAVTLDARSTTGVVQTITCKKGKAIGAFLTEGPSSFNQTITLEGCRNSTSACGNVSAEAIETNELHGELAFSNEAETKLGSVIGAFFTNFKCGTAAVELRSDLIGTVTNSAKGFSVKYSIKNGKQEDQFFYIEGAVGPLSLVSEPEKFESPIKATETITEIVQA